jgi:hypothetical protein
MSEQTIKAFAFDAFGTLVDMPQYPKSFQNSVSNFEPTLNYLLRYGILYRSNTL